MEDFGVFRAEYPNYFSDHPDHCWPAGKLGLDLDDVFTTLPRQFNLMAIPILDRESFRLETQHAASIAHDRSEFYDLLKSRLKIRREEQISMMVHTLKSLAWDPRQIDEPGQGSKHWAHAMHIARSKSFDTIVRFLAGFLRDEKNLSSSSISHAGQGDHPAPSTDAAIPDQKPIDATCNAPAELLSQPPSTASTLSDSPASNMASSSSGPRKRKRSLTPASAILAGDNEEDDAQTSKRLRLDNDIFGPKVALEPHRPGTFQAKRVRGVQPSFDQPTISTRTPAAITQADSSGLRPGPNNSSNRSVHQQRGREGTASKLTPQDVEPPTVLDRPDAVDTGHSPEVESYYRPVTARTRSHQSSRHPRPREGKWHPSRPPSSASSIKVKSKIQKPVPKRVLGQARDACNSGAARQISSSQRITRQTRTAEQPLHELDWQGKARSAAA